jgi:hypothetical protein
VDGLQILVEVWVEQVFGVPILHLLEVEVMGLGLLVVDVPHKQVLLVDLVVLLFTNGKEVSYG